jgi:hypothetical protein
MDSDMRIAKAWVSFAGVLVTSLTAALSDDVVDISDTTQVIVTLVPALATLYAVYRTPNRDV